MKNPDIIARRLFNQHLTGAKFETPEQVVGALGAVQAQDYSGARWGVAARMAKTTDAEIEKAFDAGRILRTHVMRPTWHFVLPEDIAWLLELTAPRVNALSAGMYRQLELDDATFKKSNAILTKALKGGKQLTRTELGSALEKAGISTRNGIRLGYLMHRAELDRVVISGARRGKQFTYALFEERTPHAKTLKRDEALVELMRRYFTTRGPASLQDFMWWSGLTMADAKNGIEYLKSEFENDDHEGQRYWFPASAVPKKLTKPRVDLLPNYDEYFIGFKDRDAFGARIREQSKEAVMRALYAHIVFINGEIVGGWRRNLVKGAVEVKLDLIAPVTKAEERAIAEAAREYADFLGMKLVLGGETFTGRRELNLFK